MSTVKNNTTSARFAKIASLGEIIFHTNDLAQLWEIKKPNTLHTTLTRYTKQNLLFRIYRGFYALKPIEKLDPYLLGIKAMHRYTYISTETVLINAGIIQQNIENITLISSQSKSFSIGNYHYNSRQLAEKYLYRDIGIQSKNNIRIASTERAVADLLYFNPHAHFDAQNLIDWKKVKEIQTELGYLI